MSSHPPKPAQRRPKIVHAGEGMRLHVQGIVFTYKAVGADTDGQYALTESIVPPHHGEPEHIHHREDEAFYILEGEFEIECGGEVFKAVPGTFALLAKGSSAPIPEFEERPSFSWALIRILLAQQIA